MNVSVSVGTPRLQLSQRFIYRSVPEGAAATMPIYTLFDEKGGELRFPSIAEIIASMPELTRPCPGSQFLVLQPPIPPSSLDGSGGSATAPTTANAQQPILDRLTLQRRNVSLKLSQPGGRPSTNGAKRVPLPEAGQLSDPADGFNADS